MSQEHFERFAETYLVVTLRGGTEWMCVCPLHDDRGASLQFNVKKGLWVCFGCQSGGSAKNLARRLDVSFEEPSLDTLELRKRLNDVVKHKRDAKEIEVLPESFLRRFSIERHPDWYDRGFTDATIDFWGLGYDFMQDELTIPYRTPSGDLLGVIRRRRTAEFPRYLYPKGFDRSGSLYGSWEPEPHVALVEGTLDAVKTWQNGMNAMSVYGSSISARQVSLLKKIGVKKIDLFFDYDEAGITATKTVGKLLDGAGFIVYKMVWDKSRFCWQKSCTCSREHRPDPGMLDKEEFVKMSESAVLVGTSEETMTYRKKKRILA